MATKVKQGVTQIVHQYSVEFFSAITILFFAIMNYVDRIDSQTLLLIIFVLVSVSAVEQSQARENSTRSKWIFLILMVLSLIAAVFLVL